MGGAKWGCSDGLNGRGWAGAGADGIFSGRGGRADCKPEGSFGNGRLLRSFGWRGPESDDD